MTTPTREQVIEWAKEAGLAFNQSLEEFSTPLLDGAYVDEIERLCTIAMYAGREQGLREAKEACWAEELEGTSNEARFYNKACDDCAAAIEQLRGK